MRETGLVNEFALKETSADSKNTDASSAAKLHLSSCKEPSSCSKSSEFSSMRIEFESSESDSECQSEFRRILTENRSGGGFLFSPQNEKNYTNQNLCILNANGEESSRIQKPMNSLSDTESNRQCDSGTLDLKCRSNFSKYQQTPQNQKSQYCNVGRIDSNDWLNQNNVGSLSKTMTSISIISSEPRNELPCPDLEPTVAVSEKLNTSTTNITISIDSPRSSPPCFGDRIQELYSSSSESDTVHSEIKCVQEPGLQHVLTVTDSNHNQQQQQVKFGGPPEVLVHQIWENDNFVYYPINNVNFNVAAQGYATRDSFCEGYRGGSQLIDLDRSGLIPSENEYQEGNGSAGNLNRFNCIGGSKYRSDNDIESLVVSSQSSSYESTSYQENHESKSINTMPKQQQYESRKLDYMQNEIRSDRLHNSKSNQCTKRRRSIVLDSSLQTQRFRTLSQGKSPNSNSNFDLILDYRKIKFQSQNYNQDSNWLRDTQKRMEDVDGGNGDEAADRTGRDKEQKKMRVKEITLDKYVQENAEILRRSNENFILQCYDKKNNTAAVASTTSAGPWCKSPKTNNNSQLVIDNSSKVSITSNCKKTLSQDEMKKSIERLSKPVQRQNLSHSENNSSSSNGSLINLTDSVKNKTTLNNNNSTKDLSHRPPSPPRFTESTVSSRGKDQKVLGLRRGRAGILQLVNDDDVCNNLIQPGAYTTVDDSRQSDLHGEPGTIQYYSNHHNSYVNQNGRKSNHLFYHIDNNSKFKQLQSDSEPDPSKLKEYFSQMQFCRDKCNLDDFKRSPISNEKIKNQSQTNSSKHTNKFANISNQIRKSLQKNVKENRQLHQIQSPCDLSQFDEDTTTVSSATILNFRRAKSQLDLRLKNSRGGPDTSLHCSINSSEIERERPRFFKQCNDNVQDDYIDHADQSLIEQNTDGSLPESADLIVLRTKSEIQTVNEDQINLNVNNDTSLILTQPVNDYVTDIPILSSETIIKEVSDNDVKSLSVYKFGIPRSEEFEDWRKTCMNDELNRNHIDKSLKESAKDDVSENLRFSNMSRNARGFWVQDLSHHALCNIAFDDTNRLSITLY